MIRIVFLLLTLGTGTLAAAVVPENRVLAFEVMGRMQEVLLPLYNQLEPSMVEGITEVKRNVTQLISALEAKVIEQKAIHLQQAIDQELQIQEYVQTHHVDEECAPLIQELIDDDMDIAGYGFSNCIVTRVAEGLQKEIDAMYASGLWPEYRWLNSSLLEVFDGGNIFSEPAVLLNRLEEKQAFLEEESMLDFLPDLVENIEILEKRLSSIETAYVECLQINLLTLNMAFEIIKLQITQVCY
ncbi:uncharacterized protein LOC118458217 [Anopheles albimanus]|uniref:uncharacterized protein LOC118458217 n=1 Tax=Anopheles albimanus TaxID=7167 RepID=UPI00163E60D9|nr:uncharacterized protein LOC118458217 [Anopheles albimanus]